MSEPDSYRLAYPCQSCGKAIELRRFGRRPSYCSSKCRTAAFRQPGEPSNSLPGELAHKSPNSPIEIIEELDRLSLHGRRTADKSHPPSPWVTEPVLDAPAATAEIRYTRRPKAIPDAIYPAMWRVQWPDGRVSDMANRTRVNDAIANFLA